MLAGQNQGGRDKETLRPGYGAARPPGGKGGSCAATEEALRRWWGNEAETVREPGWSPGEPWLPLLSMRTALFQSCYRMINIMRSCPVTLFA